MRRKRERERRESEEREWIQILSKTDRQTDKKNKNCYRYLGYIKQQIFIKNGVNKGKC